jgi:DNA-binding response OmpR family regulator
MPLSKVLIVDDDANSRAVLRDVLASEPYSFCEACSGREAIEIAERELPDLILLDIMMPDMDGEAVLRYLKGNAKTQEIPVILVTALDIFNTQVCESLGDGAVDHVCKPYSGEVVRARVRAACRSRTSSVAGSRLTST